MSTPFLRGRPWNSAHVFNVSLPKLLRMAFPVFFVVFFAGNVGSLKTQISQKPERAKYLAKKKDKVKTQFVKGSARAHQTRLQNFRVYMDSEGIWGFMPEPACIDCRSLPRGQDEERRNTTVRGARLLVRPSSTTTKQNTITLEQRKAKTRRCWTLDRLLAHLRLAR